MVREHCMSVEMSLLNRLDGGFEQANFHQEHGRVIGPISGQRK